MDAQQLKMDVIANNLANASTTGFKRTRAEFEDLLSETIQRHRRGRARAAATTPRRCRWAWACARAAPRARSARAS